MPNTPLPEWDALLSSVAHLRQVLPEAVLVGGTAAAIYAHHRLSIDHDHTLDDLDDTDLTQYKQLKEGYHDWSVVKSRCIALADLILKGVAI